jgi:hypothetical protein
MGRVYANVIMDERIRQLVGRERYPVRELIAADLDAEGRARYGLADWQPSTSTGHER